MPINKPPFSQSTCAISVIIPMYNAEKYLPVCLESILIQTFTDFELLVVDDCSTDSSYAIAESYLEKFGGRLKIVSLPQNTGSGAVPRNVGLDLSQGKYVCFVDNDDLLVDNALETLYNFAEDYQADFVYMEKYFTCDRKPLPKELVVSIYRSNYPLIDKPTLEPDELSERVQNFINRRFYWSPWSKFVRRDFLVDNDLNFLQAKISEDIIWTFQIVCAAEKILSIPNPLYVYRQNKSSIMNRKRSLEAEIIFWTSPLLSGVDFLDEFMRGQKFFKDNPAVRLQVLNFFALFQLNYMADALNALGVNKSYEIFLREFLAAGSSNAALISNRRAKKFFINKKSPPLSTGKFFCVGKFSHGETH